MTTIDTPRVSQLDNDLDEASAELLYDEGRDAGLAVDIETTGLDPDSASIEVVSVASPTRVIVITVNGTRPRRLVHLLESPRITLIFHHALFDLRFLRKQWGVVTDHVLCTKVAARIGSVSRNPHLADLARIFANTELDKSQQTSDWTLRPLAPEQLAYAASDVVHLHKIYRELERRLSDAGRTHTFLRAMRFLSTRVELEELELGDVFAYELD